MPCLAQACHTSAGSASASSKDVLVLGLPDTSLVMTMAQAHQLSICACAPSAAGPSLLRYAAVSSSVAISSS